MFRIGVLDVENKHQSCTNVTAIGKTQYTCFYLQRLHFFWKLINLISNRRTLGVCLFQRFPTLVKLCLCLLNYLIFCLNLLIVLPGNVFLHNVVNSNINLKQPTTSMSDLTVRKKFRITRELMSSLCSWAAVSCTVIAAFTWCWHVCNQKQETTGSLGSNGGRLVVRKQWISAVMSPNAECLQPAGHTATSVKTDCFKPHPFSMSTTCKTEGHASYIVTHFYPSLTTLTSAYNLIYWSHWHLKHL